jgi:PAS domain S-box-containing protein
MPSSASPVGTQPSSFLASLSGVFEYLPVMAWIADVDGRCTFTNHHYLTFAGRTIEQECARDWTALLHPNDRDACLSAYLKAHEARIPFHGSQRWRRSDGVYRLVEVSGVPVYDSAGTFQGYLGVCSDETDQRAAVTAPAQASGHPQLIVTNSDEIIANMDDAVLVESDNGRVVLANQAFCRLFSLDTPAQELTGMEADRLTKQLSPAAARLDKLKKRRRRSVGEEIRLMDGRVLELHYVPVAPDGAARVHLWQYRDITARKRFEAELNLSRQRLRSLAARDEAVREEERRSAARMLHDELGQLLTSVKLEVAAAAEVFRNRPDETALPVVDRLQSAAGLLDVCIKTVQRVSAKLRPTPPPETCISDAIRWEALLFEKRSRIRCRVAVSPAKLDVDSERSAVLYRILLEALTNVVRHADASAVQISLKKASGVTFLSVRDNGRGIAPEEVDNPATMGLLGMRERALGVGGDVRITRNARGGTTVMVILPLPPEPPSPVAAEGGPVQT